MRERCLVRGFLGHWLKWFFFLDWRRGIALHSREAIHGGHSKQEYLQKEEHKKETQFVCSLQSRWDLLFNNDSQADLDVHFFSVVFRRIERKEERRRSMSFSRIGIYGRRVPSLFILFFSPRFSIQLHRLLSFSASFITETLLQD
jgi:hypothetical protein